MGSWLIDWEEEIRNPKSETNLNSENGNRKNYERGENAEEADGVVTPYQTLNFELLNFEAIEAKGRFLGWRAFRGG